MIINYKFPYFSLQSDTCDELLLSALNINDSENFNTTNI